MFKRLFRKFFNTGPSDVLTIILGPIFILYGIGVLDGYRHSLIELLKLPVWFYSGLFIIAGILKLIGLLLNWGRFSHVVGVTVACFWSAAIITFEHGAMGWVASLPWIAITLITFVAVIWPDPPEPYVPDIKPSIDDNTNPAMRAIDYVSRTEERTNGNGH